jgi:hypothetical protein
LVSDIEKRKMTYKNVLAIILEPESDGGMQEWELALLN